MLYVLCRVRRPLLLAVVGAAAIGGCRTGDAGGPGPGAKGPSFLRATATGAGQGVPDDTYEGTGEFGVNDADGVSRPRTFTIHSQATDGRGERSVGVWRQQGAERALPGAGTYDVAGPDYTQSRWRTMAVTYQRVVDGWLEAYVGRAGSLTITESTAERVAGTFRFTGVRYYRRPTRGTGREEGLVLGRPDAVPPDQPTIEVSGSFAAEPWRDRGAVTR